MASHPTRGAEALPTVKILKQKLDICERNLSMELGEVDETVISADESVIRDLIAILRS